MGKFSSLYDEPDPSEFEPEEPSLLDKAIGLGGAALAPLGWPKEGVDWLAREGARAQGLPVSDTATVGELARSAAGLRPDETPDFPSRLAGAAVQTGADFALDPLNYALLGAGGLLGGGQAAENALSTARVAGDIPEATRLAAGIKRAARAEQIGAGVFGGLGAISAAHEVPQAWQDIASKGWTPETAEEAFKAAVTTGFAGLGGLGAVGAGQHIRDFSAGDTAWKDALAREAKVREVAPQPIEGELSRPTDPYRADYLAAQREAMLQRGQELSPHAEPFGVEPGTLDLGAPPPIHEMTAEPPTAPPPPAVPAAGQAEGWPDPFASEWEDPNALGAAPLVPPRLGFTGRISELTPKERIENAMVAAEAPPKAPQVGEENPELLAALQPLLQREVPPDQRRQITDSAIREVTSAFARLMAPREASLQGRAELPPGEFPKVEATTPNEKLPTKPSVTATERAPSIRALPTDEIPNGKLRRSAESAAIERALAESNGKPIPELPDGLREYEKQIEDLKDHLTNDIKSGKEAVRMAQVSYGKRFADQPDGLYRLSPKPEYHVLLQVHDGTIVGVSTAFHGRTAFIAGGKGVGSPVSAKPLYRWTRHLFEPDTIVTARGELARRHELERTGQAGDIYAERGAGRRGHAAAPQSIPGVVGEAVPEGGEAPPGRPVLAAENRGPGEAAVRPGGAPESARGPVPPEPPARPGAAPGEVRPTPRAVEGGPAQAPAAARYAVEPKKPEHEKKIDRLPKAERGENAGFMTPEGRMVGLGPHEYHSQVTGSQEKTQKAINRGYIRWATGDYPGSRGFGRLLDIGRMPSETQLAQLRKFLEEKKPQDKIAIDLSEGPLGGMQARRPVRDANGNVVGSLEAKRGKAPRSTFLQYDENTNPARVIGDIRRFYAGEDLRGVRYAVEPRTFSKLEQVLSKLPQSMTGNDLRRYLTDPKRGVKSEEIKQTNFDDFLKENSGKRVTKEQAQEFLQRPENQVRLEEHLLSGEEVSKENTPDLEEYDPEQISGNDNREPDLVGAGYTNNVDVVQEAEAKAKALEAQGNIPGFPRQEVAIPEVEHVYTFRDRNMGETFTATGSEEKGYVFEDENGEHLGDSEPGEKPKAWLHAHLTQDNEPEEWRYVYRDNNTNDRWYVEGSDDTGWRVEDDNGNELGTARSRDRAVDMIQQDAIERNPPPDENESDLETEHPIEGPASHGYESNWAYPGGTGYFELTVNAPGGGRKYVMPGAHFETLAGEGRANPVGHIRADERETWSEQLKKWVKTLFVQEFQSDWGQHGREKGFSDPKRIAAAQDAADAAYTEKLTAREAYKAVKAQAQARLGEDDAGVNWEHDPEVKKAVALLQAATDRYNDASLARANIAEGVTPGPFVTDTAAWTQLLVQRALQWAADHGYERIAWTPGWMQGERYSLRKHVDRLGYDTKNGVLTGWRENRAVISRQVKPEEIKDYIGPGPAAALLREVANLKREPEHHVEEVLRPDGRRVYVVKDEQGNEVGVGPHRYRYDAEEKRRVLDHGKNIATIKGLDLDVGDEGMRKYYDRIGPDEKPGIVPTIMDRVGQKYKVKSGTTEMPTAPGKGAPEGIPVNESGGRSTISVPYMDVKPEMKEPFPKFARESGAAGEPIPLEDIRARVEQIPGLKVAESGDHIVVTAPNGEQVGIRPLVNGIEVNPRAFAAGRGRAFNAAEERIAGQFIPREGIAALAKIELSPGASNRILLHEMWHWVEDMGVLSDREMSALKAKYKTEEERADAFADFDPRKQTNSWFTKITQFFRNLYRAFNPTWESVLEKGKAGELFERQPKYLKDAAAKVDALALKKGAGAVVSAEVAPGDGAPTWTKLGVNWSSLDPDTQKKITRDVASEVIPRAARLANVQADVNYGSGFWRTDTNPNVTIDLKGNPTPEARKLFSRLAGMGLEQTEVWTHRIVPDAQADRHGVDLFSIDKKMDFSNAVEASHFWAKVIENGSEDVKNLGLTMVPVKTDTGVENVLRVIFPEGLSGQKRLQLQDEIHGLIDKAFGDNLNVGVDPIGVDLDIAHNDWKAGDGGYRKEVEAAPGVGRNLDSFLSSSRSAIEQAVRRNVKAEGQAQGQVAPKYATEPTPEQPPPEKEGPTTGKPPEFPINLDRIGVDESVKSLEGKIVDSLREKMGAAKGYRSWGEARQKALASGLTEADFHRLLKEKGSLSDHEIEAGRILREEAGKSAKASLDALKDAEAAGDPDKTLAAQKKYDADVARFSAVAYDTVGAGAEAARALAIHRKLSEGLLPEEKFMRTILQKGKADSPEFRARLADAVTRNDRKAMNDLAREAYSPTWMDKIVEYYVNSILSGPPTLIGNVMSYLGYESMVRTPERSVAGAVDSSVRPWLEKWLSPKGTEIAEQERFAGEGYEALKALARERMGIPNIARAMWDAILNEKDEASIIMSGKAGEGRIPAIPGKLGRVVRTPTRIMSWADAASKAATAQAELAAQVFRRATIEGRQGKWTPDKFEARSQELYNQMRDWVAANNLKKSGQVLSKEQYATLRDPLLLKIGTAMEQAGLKAQFQDTATALSKGLVALRKKYPILHFIAPFITTPERILAAGFERTPIAALRTLYRVKEGKLKGGEISDELAKQVYGTAIGAMFLMAAQDGFVTGSGPTDPAQNEAWRQTGAQPYSIKIGKQYFSYKRMEPISTLLSLAGDLTEAKNEKTGQKLSDKLQGALLENISNKTWLEGIINFAEMWGDPKRYAGQFFKQIEGAAVPNVVAKVAQEFDPTVRQTSAVDLSAIGARIPGVSRLLEPKPSAAGEPIERVGLPGERTISPFIRSTQKGPEADLERTFLETGWSPARPVKALSIPNTKGLKVDLTPDEVKILTQAQARTTQRVRELAQDTRFQRLSPEDKKAYLQKLYNSSETETRKQLWSLPDVQSRARDVIRTGHPHPDWNV